MKLVVGMEIYWPKGEPADVTSLPAGTCVTYIWREGMRGFIIDRLGKVCPECGVDERVEFCPMWCPSRHPAYPEWERVKQERNEFSPAAQRAKANSAWPKAPTAAESYNAVADYRMRELELSAEAVIEAEMHNWYIKRVGPYYMWVRKPVDTTPWDSAG